MKPSFAKLYWTMTGGLKFRLLIHRFIPSKPGLLILLNPKLLK